MNLFGAKKKPESSAPLAPQQAAMQDPMKAAMAKLNETIENIGKKEDHLQRKIDAEFANAKEFHAAGKKREALQSIKKMKMYDHLLTYLGTSKINLENQKCTMESMIMSAEVIELQSEQRKVRESLLQCGEQVKKMGGVDKVEELMYAVEDALAGLDTDEREIQEAMNRSIDADDDELLAELDGLMEEELAADLSKVAGEKREALQCIKKMKVYDQQLMLETSKLNLENQKWTMESMIMNREMLESNRIVLRMEMLGEEEKKQEEKMLMDIEDDLVRLDIEARGEYLKLKEAMNRSIEEYLKLKEAMNRSIDADELHRRDDELLAELDGLMEEELAADLSKIDLGRAVVVPSTPISLYSQVAMNLFGAKKKPSAKAVADKAAAAEAKKMTDEERELAELEAAMEDRAVIVPSTPISFYSQVAMNLFGAKKKPQSSAPLAPPQAPVQYSEKAMTILNETIKTIGKKEDHLQRKYDAEFANAKEFHAAGKTREALQCIKKKKVYDQQLTQLGTSKINLENQKLTMESMIMNAEYIETVRTLLETFRTLLRQMEMDGEEEKELMDCEDFLVRSDIEARGHQEAMNRSIDADVLDELELDAELMKEDGLMKEELAADLSKVAGTKKVMRDKERELAELEASVLAMAPSELEVSVPAMAPRRRFFLDLLSPLRSLLPSNLAPR